MRRCREQGANVCERRMMEQEKVLRAAKLYELISRGVIKSFCSRGAGNLRGISSLIATASTPILITSSCCRAGRSFIVSHKNGKRCRLKTRAVGAMRRLERLISKFERMEEGPAKELLRPLFGYPNAARPRAIMTQLKNQWKASVRRTTCQMPSS